MRRFSDMTADEIMNYRGPKYCTTAMWKSSWMAGTTVLADLMEPSHAALRADMDYVLSEHPNAVFSPLVVLEPPERGD